MCNVKDMSVTEDWEDMCGSVKRVRAPGGCRRDIGRRHESMGGMIMCETSKISDIQRA